MSVFIFDLINCQLFISSQRGLANRMMYMNQVVNGKYCSNRQEWFIDSAGDRSRAKQKKKHFVTINAHKYIRYSYNKKIAQAKGKM